MEWQPDAWQNRAQFFAVSSSMMRRILVQFAREQGADKRGGRCLRVSLSEAMELEATDSDHDLVAVDAALTRLAELDERQARVVELRFFGGLSLEEAAEMLQVSVSTVRRDFRIARAWLRQQLSPAL
jgi:RNA polymerase sigma factor (TIGR02999 family)